MSLHRIRVCAGQAAVLLGAGALCTAVLAIAGTGIVLAGPAPRAPARASATTDAGGVTTDSGRPAISWTWTTIAPGPGQPRGYVAFERACSVCHGTGPAKPGTRALRAKYRGKLPALLERRTDLTPAYVKYVVRHGVSVMPPFRKTELSDADLEAIAAYLGRGQTAR